MDDDEAEDAVPSPRKCGAVGWNACRCRRNTARARFYLRYPLVFGAQLAPSLVATALWLPWRSAGATRMGLILASVLCTASALVYVPVATGIVPTGGDMMAVGYVVIATGTLVSVVAATAIGFTAAWARDKRAALATSKDAGIPTNAE